MNTKLLADIAGQVVSRTILAADESTRTIQKRFAKIGVESNPEINRQYRQLLFSAPAIEKYVSGIILYDETIRQSTDDGIPFPKLLQDKGIEPGIKVDQGTEKISPDGIDTYTKGMEGLTDRLEEYRDKFGAKFAKWRAVITIDDHSPSESTIDRNAQDLATYAIMCQRAGIVPIVEPEVLMDGGHSIERDKEVTEKVLKSVFQHLTSQGVDLKGMILKPNMITSGKDHMNQASIEEVAQTTLTIFKQIVPTAVTGIAFLSGGQSPDLATLHLNALNQIKAVNPQEYPWRLTASYGRALQGEALEAWGGKIENVLKAQKVFIARAEKVYKASRGQL